MDKPVCKLCKTRHWAYEPHVLPPAIPAAPYRAANARIHTAEHTLTTGTAGGGSNTSASGSVVRRVSEFAGALDHITDLHACPICGVMHAAPVTEKAPDVTVNPSDVTVMPNVTKKRGRPSLPGAKTVAERQRAYRERKI